MIYAYHLSGGNIRATAIRLGITRTTVRDHLEAVRLRVEREIGDQNQR